MCGGTGSRNVGAVRLSQHLLTGHLPQTGPENAISAMSVLVSDVVVYTRWLLPQDLTEANRVGLWCRQASVHPSSTSGMKIQDHPPILPTRLPGRTLSAMNQTL